MSEPSTWRELLSTIISSNSAREQIASAMHISAITLNRWASGRIDATLTKSSSARASGSRSVSFDASQASRKRVSNAFFGLRPTRSKFLMPLSCKCLRQMLKPLLPSVLDDYTSCTPARSTSFRYGENGHGNDGCALYATF